MKYYRPTFKKVYPKFLVKIFVWKDGTLQVIENEFNSRNEAFDYINKIDYIDAGIKLYNPQSELIHSHHTKHKNNDWELYT